MDPTFVSSLIALISSVGTVVAIIAAFRRQPPVTEELHRNYVTKEELRQVIDNMMKRCQEERQSRAAIYTKLDQIRADAEARNERFASMLRNELQTMATAAAEESRNVAAAIGRLEGERK